MKGYKPTSTKELEEGGEASETLNEEVQKDMLERWVTESTATKELSGNIKFTNNVLNKSDKAMFERERERAQSHAS